jgi:hypothetical protein
MSENQADLCSFYVTQARAGLSEYSETLQDVAKVLVAAKSRQPPTTWADVEFSKFVQFCMDEVHVDFGEGAWLASSIDVLVTSGLLNFVQGIILAAQAGAHLSAQLQEKRGDYLSENAQQLFLITPLEWFLADRSQYPEDLQGVVREELERCLIRATLAMWGLTETGASEFGTAWDQLVARERVDFQNRPRILKQEAQVLNEFAQKVTRLEGFAKQVRRLRIEAESSRNVLNSLQEEVVNWNKEIARLRNTL